MRKVIAIDGTFLKNKYEGVMLSFVAQDAQTHVFSVAFCVVEKECDASYQYFFKQMSSFVDDTDELCIISDRHQSISEDGFTYLPCNSLWFLHEASWGKY